jgi:outer membrane lipoprotein
MKANHRFSAKNTAIFLSIFATLFFSGCSVVSRDVRTSADPNVSFVSLKQNPAAHTGKTVILGGYILETRNKADQTRLMILQAPLDLVDEPKSRDLSRGRFIVIHDGFLDPAVYEKDRKITVAGRVAGSEKIRINEHDYILPLIRAVEIHLWQDPRPDQNIYYHDLFYDPFYDPFYPWYGPRFRYWYHPHYYR